MENPKSQALNPKQAQITNKPNPKRYDLEKRTTDYARRVMLLSKSLPKSLSNFELLKQLIRSSASVGANYIEANESLGKKDFLMRIKICRKEAKESNYWLRLIDFGVLKHEHEALLQESIELTKIFGSIVTKSQK